MIQQIFLVYYLSPPFTADESQCCEVECTKFREREKAYSPQYNNTAVETVSNNTKWSTLMLLL